MRLTLAMLFACWTIYSSGIVVVLSLPPSLIANAASLHQQHQQQHNTKTKREQLKFTNNFNGNGLWHKDVKAAKTLAEQQRAKNKEGGNLLAAAAASDIINHQQQQHSGNSPQHSSTTDKAHPRKSRMVDLDANVAAIVPIDPRSASAALQQSGDAAAAYDLNGLPQSAAAVAPTINDDDHNNDGDNDTSDTINDEEAPLPQPLPPITLDRAMEANEFFTPLKYWARHCQPGKNCPKQYYRALLSTTNNRNPNKEVPFNLHPNGLNAGNKRLNNFGVGGFQHEFYEDDEVEEANNDEMSAARNFEKDQNPYNDIFLYLNGEQDLITFLRWAMQLLYPHERFANYSATGADYYHPGMFIWKKLNLSGNTEPPLYVEEPHYLIVRREQLGDDFKRKSSYKNDDPFIPPRGRKHNMPDLDALLHRYETFVPNRGRRDKIKDMLKSDDLFFPNRGKRLNKPPTSAKKATEAATTTILAANKCALEYENGSINHNSKSNSKSNVKVNVNRNNEKNNYNKNNKNNDEADEFEAKVWIDDDNIENESYNNNDNNNNDDVDDWNKKLPLALIMRDTLVRLWHKKLQNQHEKLQNAAGGNKITRNAHEINYFSDNSKNNNYNNKPEWLPAMLNYKFNGYDPTTSAAATAAGISKQSMPMAMTIINGETREMSTPKVAETTTKTKNEALMQLMLQLQQQQHQQPQLQQSFNDFDEISTATTPFDLYGVDSDADAAASSRLISTRSMSAAMAHRRQQQQLHHKHQQQHQRHLQLQRQRQRQLAALSEKLNANAKHEHANWQHQQHQKNQPSSSSSENSNSYHHLHHRLLKPLTNFQSLFWRQLQQLPYNNYNTNTNDDEDDSDNVEFSNLQQKRKVPAFRPQEALRRQSFPMSSNAPQRLTSALEGEENNAYFNDYNYFDI